MTDLIPGRQPIDDLKSSHLSRIQPPLIYAGKSYVRMLLIKSGVEVLDQSKRTKCNLWLCIEDSVRLPTRTLIVPEVLP